MKLPDRPKKKLGLTSVEAAALYLSDGKTADPAQAVLLDKGQEMDLDKLQQAHLRRMMGFDFRIKIRPNKIHISSKQPPYVTTYTKVSEGDIDNYGNILNEATIDRLVEACLRLKNKYETELARTAK